LPWWCIVIPFENQNPEEAQVLCFAPVCRRSCWSEYVCKPITRLK